MKRYSASEAVSTAARRTLTVVALFLAITVIPTPSTAAQDRSPQPQYEIQSDYYHITSGVDRDHASATARRMEAMLQLYNSHFRFPLEELSEPFRVRIFASQDRYDTYLQTVIGETRQGFVYLHYRDPRKSELVGYYTPDGGLEQSLIHQSFVQFLRGFIQHPPLWIREGFAVYYEASRYNPETNQAVYRENLAWLDTLKAILDTDAIPFDAIPFDTILSMTQEEARNNLNVFYPQAWGMVSFLLDGGNPQAGNPQARLQKASRPATSRPETTNPDISRILWDSISAMKPQASLEENVDAVYRSAFRWVDQTDLTRKFRNYIASRKTYQGWVSYGVEAFNNEEYQTAEDAFINAVNLDEDETGYVPYYYLGLIHYQHGTYSLADYYYQEALARGSDNALTLYALGANAYADNRYDDAEEYLEETVRIDPSYRDKARTILTRIRG